MILLTLYSDYYRAGGPPNEFALLTCAGVPCASRRGPAGAEMVWVVQTQGTVRVYRVLGL